MAVNTILILCINKSHVIVCFQSAKLRVCSLAWKTLRSSFQRLCWIHECMINTELTGGPPRIEISYFDLLSNCVARCLKLKNEIYSNLPLSFSLSPTMIVQKIFEEETRERKIKSTSIHDFKVDLDNWISLILELTRFSLL